VTGHVPRVCGVLAFYRGAFSSSRTSVVRACSLTYRSDANFRVHTRIAASATRISPRAKHPRVIVLLCMVSGAIPVGRLVSIQTRPNDVPRLQMQSAHPFAHLEASPTPPMPNYLPVSRAVSTLCTSINHFEFDLPTYCSLVSDEFRDPADLGDSSKSLSERYRNDSRLCGALPTGPPPLAVSDAPARPLLAPAPPIADPFSTSKL
jgi:hypothetical protein